MPGNEPGFPGKAIVQSIERYEEVDCEVATVRHRDGTFCGEGAEDGKSRESLGAHLAQHSIDLNMDRLSVIGTIKIQHHI